MNFVEYLKTLEPKNWEVQATKSWTVKDVVAHLVGWEKEVVNTLDEAIKTGEHAWFMKEENWDTFNKTNTEYYKHYTPEELIKEWKMWQERLEEKIQQHGEKKLKGDKDMEYLFDEEDGHYQHHFNQIKKALENK